MVEYGYRPYYTHFRRATDIIGWRSTKTSVGRSMRFPKKPVQLSREEKRVKNITPREAIPKCSTLVKNIYRWRIGCLLAYTGVLQPEQLLTAYNGKNREETMDIKSLTIHFQELKDSGVCEEKSLLEQGKEVIGWDVTSTARAYILNISGIKPAVNNPGQTT